MTSIHTTSAIGIATRTAISEQTRLVPCLDEGGDRLLLALRQQPDVLLDDGAQCTERTGFTCAEPTSGSLDDRKNHTSTGLRASCDCAVEQHYVYRWDELNRLAEARRYDRTGGFGHWDLEVRQRQEGLERDELTTLKLELLDDLGEVARVPSAL